MPVLVMGPGRSGSRYMNDMMKTLGYESIHEVSRKFREGKYIEDCDWEGAGDWLSQKDKKRALCGFPYGMMVHYLRHRIPGLHVVCVHRDKASWLVSSGGNVKVGSAQSYPMNLRDKEHYWELYEHLMWSIAPPVLHLEMKDLNTCKPKVIELIATK